ncbi:unnamed protein product [Calypogeia fissa]
MAWLGKISTNLGNLSDFAGAVNKLQESVKNIERNFDSALGFEARSSESSEVPPAVSDKRGPAPSTEPPVAPVIQAKDISENGSSQAAEPSLLNNVFGFARANFEKAQKQLSEPQVAVESTAEKPQQNLEKGPNDVTSNSSIVPDPPKVSEVEVSKVNTQEIHHDPEEATKALPEADSAEVSLKSEASQQASDSTPIEKVEDGVKQEVVISGEESGPEQIVASTADEQAGVAQKDEVDTPIQDEVIVQEPQSVPLESGDISKDDPVDASKKDIVEEHPGPPCVSGNEEELERSDARDIGVNAPHPSSDPAPAETYVIGGEDTEEESDGKSVAGMHKVHLSSNLALTENFTRSVVSEHPEETAPAEEKVALPAEPSLVEDSESVKENNELTKLREDLKMMEAALHGAAKQSQSKADEISRLMIENEELKLSLEDLQRKTSSVELDALREEYQQRVGAAERKVYALTKERDMLRREQSRKSDSSLLLKEKDEIIKQVMAEGEELSKKQALQEGTMRKLRAQIRELEEEKQRLNSRVQVEEGKVESIRKDKAVTEAALQEAVEKGQAELASLREYYTIALNEAKDAQAEAEAKADSEAKADLERRFREAADRETTLLQTLEDLRQALSRTEQQAAFREDMHRSDLADLEKRCQAAEARYEELVTHMPDSTRPLRKQIEALQESTAMRAEAWTGVERSLNSRLHEAEMKAAAAQERERAINERLSQTLSRVAVMEAQLSMLRAEQAQLTRSLEKERQRASESRQEYLAATELSTTLEGRAKQLEEEFEEMRIRHKQELKEERARRHALEQELDQEKALIADYEKRLRAEGRSVIDKGVIAAPTALQTEFSSSQKAHKRLPSVSSMGSVEENFVTQASMDSDGTPMPRLSFSDRPPSPFVRGSGASLEQLEAQLRQKEGELSSCFQRLAALESTRDSLAEELVRASTQGEVLRTEAGYLPGLRAELDSLRRRHTSALELMGERDEEVEELKADLSDVKQMYREQITMLVNQIERLSATITSR